MAAGAAGPPLLPQPEQLQGELVGPLAVVQHDQGGAVRRAQGIQQRDEGVPHAVGPERLGAQLLGPARPENLV